MFTAKIIKSLIRCIPRSTLQSYITRSTLRSYRSFSNYPKHLISLKTECEHYISMPSQQKLNILSLLCKSSHKFILMKSPSQLRLILDQPVSNNWMITRRKLSNKSKYI